ncbi:MAG: hypothetical protein ABII82_01040 [Verrucomicrobiota bacterium]
MQAEVLRSGMNKFESYWWPQMKGEMQATGGRGLQSLFAAGPVADTNRAFGAAMPMFERSMAQRGLTGSGLESMGLGQMLAARSGAVSDALQKATLANLARRQQFITMGLGMSPQPTTAAPFITESKARQGGWAEPFMIG